MAVLQRSFQGAGCRVAHSATCRARRRAPSVTVASIVHSTITAATVVATALPAPTVQRTVQELDPASFDDFVTGSDGLCLVDYYTDWCGPCKLMHKEVDKLTATFKNVKFAKLNCGDCEDFSARQRIRVLPTFRLYYKGACLDEITGAKPVQLRQLLTHYLFMTSRSA